MFTSPAETRDFEQPGQQSSEQVVESVKKRKCAGLSITQCTRFRTFGCWNHECTDHRARDARGLQISLLDSNRILCTSFKDQTK